MLAVFLFGLVPGAFLLAAVRWIGQMQPPEKAARLLLYLLLAVLLLFLSGLLVVDFQSVSSTVLMITAPAALASIPLIYLVWRTTPSLQIPRTRRILILGGIAAIMLGIVYGRFKGDFFFVLLIIGGGFVITLVWGAAQTRGWTRGLVWLLLAVVSAFTFSRHFVYNGVLLTWPDWLQSALSWVGWMLWPVVAVGLIGVLVRDYIAPASTNRWKRPVGVAAVGLIMVVLAYQFYETNMLDWATDGLRVVVIITFLAIPVVAVGLLLAWKHPLRTVLIYAGVVAVIAGTMSLVMASSRTSPLEIMEGRAAQVDAAVQAYYQANGRYPADLRELVPGQLLFIPNPLIFDNQAWCYEGGADYYRMGYVSRPTFGVPEEYITIQLQGEAGEPPAETWDCDTQLADYRARYGYRPANDY